MKRYRRITGVLLAALLLLSAAAFSAGALITYVCGDANGDSQVDIRDVTLAQRVLANLESDSKGTVKRNCDVDGRGLSITDITRIQRYLAEFGDSDRIGKTFSYDEYELPFVPNV